MRKSLLASSFSLFVLVAGCGKHEHTPEAAVEKAPGHDDHAHPTKGPNGGDLIELGDEEYHAELVHDDKADEITIYILDSSAKQAVLIEATELTINLKHHGKPEQHKLVAAPKEGEVAGKSSRFIAKGNADLNEDIEHHDSEPQLQVTIGDKAFTGKIVHDHDHEGHDDHDHDPEEKAEKK